MTTLRTEIHKLLARPDFAERLNVSRQPVSHALRLLKRQGLVVEHGRRGLSVAPIDPAEPLGTLQGLGDAHVEITLLCGLRRGRR